MPYISRVARLGLTAVALACGGITAIAFQRAETLPCPGPATEAALIGVARAGASDDRVIEWMVTCGVAFPVGIEGLERLVQAGVSVKVTAAAVTGRYFYLLSNPSDENIAWILANIPPGRVAPPLGADDKAALTKTMATPMVAAIRTLLDQYQSAKHLMTEPEDQRRARLLDALPPEVLTSRFMLLAVNPHLGGGETVTIMFTNPSHMVLDVHVTAGVVMFLRQKPLSTEVRERLANYYGDALKDAEHLR